MTKVKKLAASTIVAVFMLGLFSTAADASTLICTIRGNGADSTNKCSISLRRSSRRARRPRLQRPNRTRIQNRVWVGANTGGNVINKTTGGDVDLDTGNVDIVVKINNNL